MLAENTEIDARTRWREAIELLQNDSRFKNVENSNDREDLFRDFVQELEKKEKEDKVKQRDTAMKSLTSLFDELQANDIIDRKSAWADCKKEILQKANGPEFKPLDDVDIKRFFQEFIGRLDTAYREEEKRKREQLQSKINTSSSGLKTLFETLSFDGLLKVNSRWKDWTDRVELTDSVEYKQLDSLLSDSKSSTLVGTTALDVTRSAFERVQLDIREAYRTDKRLIRDVIDEIKFELRHDTTLADFKLAMLTFAGVKKAAEQEKVARVTDSVSVATVVKGILTEDGEEIEDSGSGKLSLSKQLRAMLVKRPASLTDIYEEFVDQAKLDYEEVVRRQKKREDRFLDLLEDSFYRSDHLDVTWDQAKEFLSRHSSYDILAKADRKRLFTSHMDQLAKKMEVKTKSMRSLIPAVPEVITTEQFNHDRNVDKAVESVDDLQGSNLDKNQIDADTLDDSDEEKGGDKRKRVKKEKSEKRSKKVIR